ncbi:MAG: hypothetical protein K6E83_10470 [Clostridium sp.]|nr:hypothetical protein [Clostridium sp.]
MPTLEKKKDYAERAAKAYAEFKRRTDHNRAMTREEKAERREMFLEAHVSIFDDYYDEINARPRQGGRIPIAGNEMLSRDAQDMALDIAALFGTSSTGLFVMSAAGAGQENVQARALDRRGMALHDQADAEDSPTAHLTTINSTYKKKIKRASMDFSDAGAAPAAVSVIDPHAQSQARITQARARQNQTRARQTQTSARQTQTRLHAENTGRQAEEARRNWNRLDSEAADIVLNDRFSPDAAPALEAAEQAKQAADAARHAADQAQADADAARADADQARADADQARADADRIQTAEENDPAARRGFSIQVRDDGLSAAQIKGIREVTAFLYRNTLHGGSGNMMDRGYLVDSILKAPPRQKLLIYYLIQNDMMHGNLTEPEIVRALMFTPVLEEFKPHILGALKGVFGRWKGDSLKWSKLSAGVHGAEDLLPKVDKMLGLDAAAAGGAPAGGAVLDPQLAQAIQDVVQAGRILTANPNPTQEQVAVFVNAVKDLNALTAAEEGNFWDNSQSWLTDKNKYVGYLAKPLGVIAGVLGGIAKLKMDDAAEVFKDLPKDERDIKVEAAGRDWNDAKLGFSWYSVPLGTLSALVSCITLLGSFVNIFRQTSARDVGMQLLRFTNDTASTCNSVYSSVRGIAGLAGADWIIKAAAVNAAGGAAIGVGVLSGLQGYYRTIQAQNERDRINEFRAGISQKQQGVLEEKRQMLLEIIDAERASTDRREEAGKWQQRAAAAQVFAGAALLFSGGTAAIVSAAASGVGFVLGLAGVIRSVYLKSGEKKDVVDRYIDLDGFYDQFVADHGGPGPAFDSKYGEKKDCKNMLREFALRSLSFTSVDEMYTHIIRKFSEALYKGTFLGNDGTVMDTGKLRTEAAQNPADQQQREMFEECLKAFGFEVKYPTVAGEKPEVKAPYPGVNVIFKKLMK